MSKMDEHTLSGEMFDIDVLLKAFMDEDSCSNLTQRDRLFLAALLGIKFELNGICEALKDEQT